MHRRLAGLAAVLAALPPSGGELASPDAPTALLGTSTADSFCFRGVPSAPSAGAVAAEERVAFVSLDDLVQRVTSPGLPDYMLENVHALPASSELHAPTADADAEELFADLTALHSRKSVKLSDALFVHGLLEYGVSSTIHALVYHVLLAYIEGRLPPRTALSLRHAAPACAPPPPGGRVICARSLVLQGRPSSRRGWSYGPIRPAAIVTTSAPFGT